MQYDSNFIDQVRNGTYYIGARTIRNEVVWFREAWNDSVLVTRVSRDENNIASQRVALTTSLLDPACLTIVALLSSDHFFLDADSGWTGPTSRTPDFAHLCLSARAVAPPLECSGPLGADFPQVMDNIEFLANKVGNPTSRKRGALDSAEQPRFQSIRIQHELFEPRNADDTEAMHNIESDTHTDIPIDHWPVQTIQAREELAKIVDTHKVYRIPAYDVTGDLIHPSDYRRKLMGAVVYTAFTLRHSVNIPGGDFAHVSDRVGDWDDVYVADVQHMLVLVPPAAVAI